MAKNNKTDMSCARVKKYTASDVSKAERHNERKNETYENMNVIEERISYNVHFKKPFAPTYMEQLKQMETDGMVSLRGLRKDATLFNEIVIDVNTMYFERNGGYEYAKQFYEEAFHFIEEKFGADNVISAVMHADEIKDWNRQFYTRVSQRSRRHFSIRSSCYHRNRKRTTVGLRPLENNPIEKAALLRASPNALQPCAWKKSAQYLPGSCGNGNA